ARSKRHGDDSVLTHALGSSPAQGLTLPVCTLLPYTTLFRSLSCPSGGAEQAVLSDRTPERCGEARQVGKADLPRFATTLRGTIRDRKSTRLNSSDRTSSYAVFFFKKKRKDIMKSVTACWMPP